MALFIFFMVLGGFVVGSSEPSAFASPRNCSEALARVGKGPRPSRRFRPRVEELEPRVPLVATIFGDYPDDSAVYLLNRSGTIIPGVQNISGFARSAFPIAGSVFVELDDGNYVPPNYTAVGNDGGFTRFSSLDQSLPNSIPQRGLTLSEVLQYKTPLPPAPTGRAIRRVETLRRPNMRIVTNPRLVLISERSLREKLAHAHALLDTYPKTDLVFMSPKEAEARWGHLDYTIDGFREGDLETRAAMAVDLVRYEYYLGAEFYLVHRDLGASDGFFINDAVPAYLIDNAVAGDRWQLIFLPDREGARVEAIRIEKVQEPPVSVDYHPQR